MTIIPSDTLVTIDGNPINGIDMSWIPLFETKSGIMTSVHAVQWYHDKGEIELECNEPNIEMTELGIFEEAISKYEEKKLQIEQEIANNDLEIEELNDDYETLLNELLENT
jgi:hypothetical protein